MAAWIEISPQGGSIDLYPCLPRASLKVSRRNGLTEEFVLPAELPRWDVVEKDPEFQASIRGLGLIFNGSFYSLPAPSGLARPRYSSEILLDADRVVAFRIGYHAHLIQTRMTIYTKGSPPLCRFDVAKVGRLVWRP